MRLVDKIFYSMLGKAEPYIDCDYLESDGRGHYINTGYIPNQNTRVVCKAQITHSERFFVFGARTSYSGGAFLCRLSNGSGVTSGDYGTQRHNLGNVSQADIYTIDANKNVWTRTGDGSVIMTTFTSQVFEVSRPIALFALLGERLYADKGRILECQIYDNDVLVRDYQPKIRQADGVTGYYDVVNNTFNPSANGVNFLYGYLT
jgi:hypothetical protein